MVNVASRCGLAPKYEQLEDLQRRYRDRRFTVIGFPSNQFLQELGSSEAIADYCSATWGVTFPMAEKVRVNGRNAHPLYKQLTTLADAGMIEYEKGTIRPGQRAVVVTGPVDDESTAARIASLSRTLDAEGAGTVVVSPISSGGGQDAVVTLRSSGQSDASTVDTVGSDAGRLATVLALAGQLDGEQGDYGVRQDATAAAPSLPPGPTR